MVNSVRSSFPAIFEKVTSYLRYNSLPLPLQVLIDELQLHGQLSAQQFLQQREEILDRLFPSSPLMPGEAGQAVNAWSSISQT
jgi:hypothetical protein